MAYSWCKKTVVGRVSMTTTGTLPKRNNTVLAEVLASTTLRQGQAYNACCKKVQVDTSLDQDREDQIFVHGENMKHYMALAGKPSQDSDLCKATAYAELNAMNDLIKQRSPQYVQAWEIALGLK